jgi:hypothetical protein
MLETDHGNSPTEKSPPQSRDFRQVGLLILARIIARKHRQCKPVPDDEYNSRTPGICEGDDVNQNELN